MKRLIFAAIIWSAALLVALTWMVSGSSIGHPVDNDRRVGVAVCVYYGGLALVLMVSGRLNTSEAVVEEESDETALV